MQIGVIDGVGEAIGGDPFDLSAVVDPEADSWMDGPEPVPSDVDGCIPEELVEGAAPPPPSHVVVDPVDRLVGDLRVVDLAMAQALRLLAEAGPRDGLSARRQVALLADATGADVAFLDRAVQVLAAMPRIQAAFDHGLLSWGQVRGIVVQARRLTVAQRDLLDQALAGELGRGRGEPDRIVEVAGDLVARLDEAGQERLEADQARSETLSMQFDFDGWAQINGLLAPDAAATVAEGLDAMADAPVAADAPPVTDDDGKPLPKAAQPNRSRGFQWAQAWERMAALVLGRADADGTLRRARPRGIVIAPLAHLTDDPAAAPTVDPAPPTGSAATGSAGRPRTRAARGGWTPTVTSRLLLRRGNGRRRISRALTSRLTDDADLIAVFTDEHGIPVAVGDSYAPITLAMRRAVEARDQGCRAPGCSTPVQHCDLHHVIPREQGGATEVANLVAVCRPCHTKLALHRWLMTLHPDGTLTTRIGRTTFTTRPRLTGPAIPPTPDRDRQPASTAQPLPF